MKTSDRFPISDHCDGRRFFNPEGRRLPRFSDVVRWKLGGRAKPWPRRVSIATAARRPLSLSETRLTWINHATFLIETPQGNFLTDPVFSKRCGPLGRLGPARTHPPGLALHELPSIHYVLLSHDHYDHCDLPSLRLIARAHDPVAFTPLGNGELLKYAGFSRVIELDWWQACQRTPNLRITATPAQHWSSRLGQQRSSRLWSGFFLHAGQHRIYFAGDTGYAPGLFTGLAQRLGQPDLALLPIGAYEPRWFMSGQHCDPAEALKIHRDLGARTSVAMHWGTFRLADEGRDDPPQALQAALAASDLNNKDFRVLAPGGHIVFPN